MTIREKIQAREAEHRNGSSLNKALWRAFLMIMGGYFGGAIIGEILRRLIRG